jgi:rRNA maturation protein Nop10
MGFHVTDRRWCLRCEKVYLATIMTVREGGSQEPYTLDTPCPDCGTDGQIVVKP